MRTLPPLALFFAVAVAVAALTGCGSAYYNASVSSAQTRLDQAQALGAETAAPYEYYYAKEHLQEARLQAADSSYHDAAMYAETAQTFAQKAIDKVQAHPEAGK